MASSEQQEETVWEWDFDYDCIRRNGVLDPMPLRCIPPPPQEAGPSAPPPASQEAGPSAPPPVSQEAGPSAPPVSQEARPFAEPQRHEPQPASQAGVRRKRNLLASHILERRLFSFQLFHCKDTQEYILAMTEVGTVNTTFYGLLPYEKNGKRKIVAKEINIGQRVICPVVGEIYEKVDNRSNLSIEQRLEGKWIIELRRRNETMKTESFYSHERVDRTFRSMNEVATFIGYNVIY